jgi:hypothetical protein
MNLPVNEKMKEIRENRDRLRRERLEDEIILARAKEIEERKLRPVRPAQES